MSDENYPERIVVEKLTQFGEALQGKLMGTYIFPPNFPGKKIADKIDELIAIVEGEGGVFALKTDLEAEAAAREAYDAQQDQKIQTLNGHYYPIEPYDFGKSLDVKTPNPDDVVILNTYAMTMEGAGDPSQIIDGTVIKNLFDGVEFVWNAASQTWQDWGVGNIVTASNDHLGVVEGTADPGDGSKDGRVTVHPGGLMEAIGFGDLKNRMEDAEDGIAGKVDKSGDGMTGDLDMDGHKVIAVGQLNVAEIRSITGIEGDSIKVGGILDLESYRITDVGDPVNAGDAATKGYVDAVFVAVNGVLDTTGLYSIYRPDLWPTGIELNFRNGLYGRRQIRTGSNIEAWQQYWAFYMGADVRVDKFIDSGGSIAVDSQVFKIGEANWGFVSGTMPTVPFVFYSAFEKSGDGGVVCRCVCRDAVTSYSSDIWFTYTKLP